MRTIAMFLCGVATVAMLSTSSAVAQRRVIDEVLREKIRWTPEQIREAARRTKTDPAADRKLLSGSAAGGESVVSFDVEVESEVHAAINPRDTGNIIVSPILQGSAVGGGVNCPVYYTKDFGKSWKKSTFQTGLLDSGSFALGGGDPIVVFDENGTAYLTWLSLELENFQFDALHARMYWAYSIDGGETWERPANQVDRVAASKLLLEGAGSMYDKQWMAVDRTTGIYRNTVYVAFMEATDGGTVPMIGIRKKGPADSGFTQTTSPVTSGELLMVQFCDIEVDNMGKVHVTYFGSYDTTSFSLFHSVSNDGGKSFSASTEISDLYVPNFTPEVDGTTIPGIDSSRMYPCPHVAIDKSNKGTRGNLYAVWTAFGTTSDLGDGLDIYLSRSTDDGATWSIPLVVNDDARGRVRHQYYPSITVNSNGVVVVTWYDRRDDPEHRETHYYISYSFDGGASFGNSFAVSASPTDFASVGERNNGFGIGEYTQVLATSGYAIPIWTDGRANDGDLNIYSAIVPISPTQSQSGVERRTSISESFRMLDPITTESGEQAIRFEIDRPSEVELQLVDLSGRAIATLLVGRLESGAHTVPVETSDLPNGLYLYHLRTELGHASGRMLVTH